MYFVHSYFVTPENQNDVLSYTNYGDFKYCSSIQSGNITAFQFHPEKSGQKGLSIYENFFK
jgi:glutamine amidotransferase